MCESCGCQPLARSNVYQFLAVALGYPEASPLAALQQRWAQLETSLEVLQDGESLRAVRGLAPVLDDLTVADWVDDYVHCFGHSISKECPPYEAEYDQAHIFQQSQTLADIAGFYRAFGLQPAPALTERLDHISVELEFMHFLCLKEAYALAKTHSEEQLSICRQAQTKFLDDHLGQWVLGFVERLAAKAFDTVYGPMAGVLSAFLSSEMQTFGLEPAKGGTPVFVEPPDEENLECAECPLVVPLFSGVVAKGAS
ncbi:MAG TPA: molecular chaperone TorD family protein [Dehalococcoidia bacterium]|nr:molecular chaperone TorD family protein [Dehalococcoidia bacterium]